MYNVIKMTLSILQQIKRKEFLISELQRFYRKNGRSPRQVDMQRKFGYPNYKNYQNWFGSFNNGLEIANLDINNTNEDRTGLETCCVCGNYLKEGQNWSTKGLPKGQVMCYNCHQRSKSDYMNKNLDKNSKVASAFISQRIVAKTFNISLENDCNCSIGFGAKYDLYDKGRYNYINVKSSKLHKDNSWKFHFIDKYVPDVYICVGFSINKENIEYVWITDPLDDLIYNEKTEKTKKGISITNTPYGLRRAKPWEVDTKPYNDVLHSMDLDKCSVLRSD